MRASVFTNVTLQLPAVRDALVYLLSVPHGPVVMRLLPDAAADPQNEAIFQHQYH